MIARRPRFWLAPQVRLAALVCTFFVAAGCGCQRESTKPAPPVAHVQPTTAKPVVAVPAAPLAVNVSATDVATETAASLRTGGVLPARFADSPAKKAFDSRKWAQCAQLFGDGTAFGKQAWQARALGLLCARRAGHPAHAAKGFAALADAGGLLAVHARLWAAESWLEAGDFGAAEKAIQAMNLSGFARATRARRTLARAQKAAGNTKGAADTYAALIAAARTPSAALLQDGADAALAAGRQSVAAGWLRSIVANYPAGRAAKKATAALATLPEAERKLSLKLLQRRMRAAKSRHKRKLAMATATEVMKLTAKGSPRWCAAGAVKARVMEIFWLRRKEAAALYDSLIVACPDDTRSAKLWYRAGRRHANSADKAKAAIHFQRIVDKAPKTTLVDDALRWQARLLRKKGKNKAADKLLLKVLTLGGDMIEYAGWDLVWRRIQAKDWKGASKMADKAIATGVVAKRRYNLGRVQYWKGYAEWKLRRKKAAKSAWAATIRISPWSWYGMLARHRLSALDPAAERKAFAAWRSMQPKSAALADVAQPMLQDQHLLASIELSRMGLLTSARAELSAVKWPRGNRDLAMLKAALLSAVGQRTRSVAATLADHRFDLAPPSAANEARWRLAYPRPPEFAPYVEAEAAKTSVDQSFVWAIMRSESRFNPRIQSPVHATGLLQLMLGTAKGVNRRIKAGYNITYPNLMKPQINVPLGVAYMRRLQDVVGPHWALVASSYNAGPGNTRKWMRKRPSHELDTFVEAIPFKENRRYVKGVLTSWSRYRALYGSDEAAKLPIDLPTL
ncbi:MAG: transglycosylase SLT domain-containing protein [Myxococcales bacterium]|nr:transglycosylase SLT domain-containing protein [Myxococcales bacterium]